jgi:hypothetical protein
MGIIVCPPAPPCLSAGCRAGELPERSSIERDSQQRTVNTAVQVVLVGGEQPWSAIKGSGTTG